MILLKVMCTESKPIEKCKKSAPKRGRVDKFNLRSWASNCSALQNVAIQERTSHTSDEINTLGMRWNTSSDTIALTNKTTLSEKCSSSPQRYLIH